ncbi:hypothetical protein BDQ17DRAFT_1426880 [Cyathus striatus]|nr:hypothetical protein BDQ17DRAFT_1426880 [Cyathus striatus]
MDNANQATKPKQFQFGSGCPKLLIPNLRDIMKDLRSNNIPTDSERTPIINLISQVESHVILLDEEIKKYQHVASLQSQRDALHQFATFQRSLLAPIRKLPEELLTKILLMCRDSGYKCTSIYEYCTHSPPPPALIQRLARVSYYWRSVILSTPSMWTNILVNSLHLAQTYLLRSAETPLNIDFTQRYQEKMVKFHKSFAQCANRWETINIDLDDLEAILLHIPENMSFTSLKTILLYCCTESDQFTISFKATPNLTHVHIRWIRNPLEHLADFPWSQITCLVANDCLFAPNELSTLLQLMPNLSSLTFSEDTNTSTHQPIIVPQLQQFTIRFSVRTILHIDLLSAFIFPNMKTLHLLCYYPSDFNSEVTSETLRFFQRSGFSLENLLLNMVPLNEWCNCAEVKNIKYLDIKEQTYLIYDLYWLTRAETMQAGENVSNLPSSSAGSLFPQLEVLDLKVEWRERDIIDTLISMLITRLPKPDGCSNVNEKIAYLQAVNINFSWTLSSHERNAFDNFMHSDLVQRSEVDVTVTHIDNDKNIIRIIG